MLIVEGLKDWALNKTPFFSLTQWLKNCPNNVGKKHDKNQLNFISLWSDWSLSLVFKKLFAMYLPYLGIKPELFIGTTLR